MRALAVVAIALSSCAGRSYEASQEIMPGMIEIPLGSERTLDVGQHQNVAFWLSGDATVVRLQKYQNGRITLRGLGLGIADLVVVLDGKQTNILIEVVPDERKFLHSRVAPSRAEIDEGGAYSLLARATAMRAPKEVLGSLCRWVQSCQSKRSRRARNG